MQISPLHLKTLITLAQLFKDNNLDWMLVASTNLALQGINVEPHDIDIVVSEEDIEKVREILKPFAITDIYYDTKENIRSYLGKYNIERMDVEVMAKLETKLNGEWKPSMPLNSNPVVIHLAGLEIKLSSLQDQYEAYVRMNRPHKAELIKQKLEAK